MAVITLLENTSRSAEFQLQIEILKEFITITREGDKLHSRVNLEDSGLPRFAKAHLRILRLLTDDLHRAPDEDLAEAYQVIIAGEVLEELILSDKLDDDTAGIILKLIHIQNDCRIR